MHITDKEKKAIYEAMKQIRENRRLQEQELGLYDVEKGFNPPTMRMGPLGAPGSRKLNKQIKNVDAATMPPIEDIGPQAPSQEELPFTAFGSDATNPRRSVATVSGINPDGSLSTQVTTGTGRSLKSKRAGMKDARRMRTQK